MSETSERREILNAQRYRDLTATTSFASTDQNETSISLDESTARPIGDTYTAYSPNIHHQNIDKIPRTYISRRNNPSLSGISIRSFFLGASLGINSCLTVFFLISIGSRLWRVSLFVTALSLFHFLEFFITALYNPPYADIPAFLLSQNGTAYNAANLAALLECLITSLFWPGWQEKFADSRLILLGTLFMICGQFVRSLAMAQAGTNFNHTVQTRKNEGHQLVTHGIYAILRHPSYFGFFFWGIGTQMTVGNVVCFLAYSLILWNFFSRRIRKEEEYLVSFFGDDYVRYRSSTWSGIPFVR